MVDLKGRVALVTGAAKGLGAAIVVQLATQGADVAFTYLSDTDAAKDLQKKVRGLGRRCAAWAASAADYKLAQTIVAQVHRKFGALHILVCNAGVGTSAPLIKMSEAEWDSAIEVSLKGTFNYIRAAAPGFVKQNSGKIVCIGSINGLRGRVGSASYNTAKAGLLGLVKTAAAELGRHNVNVNLIAPGFIETSTQINTSELIRDLVLKECAIQRLGQPEDISPCVAFLASDDARHITGQIIKIDAGQYL
jgi:3-oxoacyl-[acyl-carrier protein] reductase